MSQKTIFYCDRCGAEMHDNEGGNLGVAELQGDPLQELELCDGCLESFRRWMKQVHPVAESRSTG